jgi:hypothetical protein
MCYRARAESPYPDAPYPARTGGNGPTVPGPTWTRVVTAAGAGGALWRSLRGAPGKVTAVLAAAAVMEQHLDPSSCFAKG